MNEHFNFAVPDRFVSTVFLHCSASNSPFHDHVQVIRQWHIEKGWADVGYHYFIRTDGTIQIGRALEKVPAAQKGHNRGSIAICLHGLNEEDFTEEQYTALILLRLSILVNVSQINVVTYDTHVRIIFHNNICLFNI